MKTIPIIDIGNQGFDCLLDEYSHHTDIILQEAVKSYTIYGLRIGDSLSKKWAESANVLYNDEMQNIAERIGTGAWMLNFSYEFGCTSSAVPDINNTARLLRVLDWSLHGLGKTLLAVKRESQAGSWLNLTWPGFVGCVQGVAPGRFAIAINHAPPSDTGFGFLPDWLAGKYKIWNNNNMPPTHLLRSVFEECYDVNEAVERLMNTPICAPVFFTIAGCKNDETILIERLPNFAVCHYDSPVISNHWITPGLPGRCHSDGTKERLACMLNHVQRRRIDAPAFSWLKPPILNECTRLVFEANPASGQVVACTYESGAQQSKCTTIKL